jgi:hypothetical protein
MTLLDMPSKTALAVPITPPAEKLPPANKRTILVELLAVLVLLAVINVAAIQYLESHTSNYGYWVIHHKWQLLKKQDTPLDWLILGDSSANQGVIPGIITAETGKRAVNLGTIGNMLMVDNLLMVQHYLERFDHLEKVVIVHVPDMWNRDFDPYLLAQVPLPWGYWNEYEIARRYVEAEEGIERYFFMDRYLPLYSQNRSLRRNIYTALTAWQSPFDQGYALDESGHFPAENAEPERVRLGAIDLAQFAAENEFRISEENLAAMDQLFRLAEERGFDVYIFNSPLYEGLLQEPAYLGYLEAQHGEMENLSAGYSRVHYIRRVAAFPAELMQNPDHLTTLGAEQYTRWLIGELENIK